MASPVFIVAKPIAEMAADGDGHVERVQHATHIASAVQYEFRAQVPVNSALFTSITWADTNTEGAVDLSSGVARFDISMNTVAFAAALADVIRDASGGKLATVGDYQTLTSANTAGVLAGDPSNLSSSIRNAQTILDREVRLEVESLLDVNGVLEYLEGDSLGGFSLFLDASAGAEDMAARMGDSGQHTTADAHLRNFFLQIPNRPTLYDAEGVSGEQTESGSLPVMVGDTLGFVFNINTTVNIQEVDTTADAAETPGTANQLGGAATVSYSTPTRRAIFIVEIVSA